MNNKKLITTGIAVMLIFITGIQCISAEEISDTELQISNIKGGLGSVTIDIENIGDAIAENITSSISVKGGFLDKIDLYKECSGCSACGTTLDPGAIKTESTLEAGLIFGMGPIDIDITAGASNADLVTATASGFVIGIFIIIQ